MPLSAADIAARHRLAEELAREGGALAMSYFERLASLAVEFKKGGQDVVSIADRSVEALIRARVAVAFPQDGVLGEEEGLTEGTSGALWIVDPIDGTSPFLAGMADWCVSIAVVEEARPVVGVIYKPTSEEMFSSADGLGATLNGAPMRVEPKRGLGEGLLGYGCNHRIPAADVARFVEVLLASGGMFYRNASGALMLAYVAAGRLVGYFEHHMNSWDCAAGLCLIREAGGWQNDFLAGDGILNGNRIAAGAPQIREELAALVEAAGVERFF